MSVSNLNTVLGVELMTINDNTYSCRYCVVRRVNNALTIGELKIVEGTLPTVLKEIPKNLPISLVLTGKGIIQKSIQVAEDLSPEQIFKTAFPATERNEFYTQQFIQGQNAMISIIRNSIAEGLINTMKRSGLNLLMVSLGAMSSVSIWEQLNSYGSDLIFDGHHFEIGDKREWLSYKYDSSSKHEFQLKIGQQIIDEKSVLAYANAFQLILHQELEPIRAEVEEINIELLTFTQNQKLQKWGLTALITLFGTLLISYGVFSYYNNENASLLHKLGGYTANSIQMSSLAQQNNENEKLLKQLNWNGGYNYGFLVSELGESMPKQLQLQELAINEPKSLTDTTAHVPSIRLQGITDNLGALNNWIFILKQKRWIKSVRLLKYEETNEFEHYRFRLLITY
ncbi:MAG: hypothetical protein EOP51_03900 [Sphingobacteriales bacterium]|nr:MAG: hypothetical protein EOP51_03900 [Sphingobacteriales bacterium]